MKEPLSFEFNFNSFIEALAYLSEKAGGLDAFVACKLIFFADKYHLTRYGRPVTGDRYIAMEHGPVPSSSYDWIKNVIRFEKEEQEPNDKFSKAVHSMFQVDFSGRYPVIHVREPLDSYDHLSESDLEALDYAYQNFAHLGFDRLRELCHRERSWKETPQNQLIDLKLMFDMDDREQAQLFELVAEEVETIRLVKELSTR